MAHPAIVIFTDRPLAGILDPAVRGSGDWRLDLGRAQAADFLVCTRNRNGREFPPADEPHRAAFLIGRKEAVVPSPQHKGRWLIRISAYIDTIIPDVWGKSGSVHLRYPVWYTTLEELGIDLAALPPFKPVPRPAEPSQLSEATIGFPMPFRTPVMPAAAPPLSGADNAARFDAILAQLDRIPDLPGPADPLQWDEHGLPR